MGVTGTYEHRVRDEARALSALREEMRMPQWDAQAKLPGVPLEFLVRFTRLVGKVTTLPAVAEAWLKLPPDVRRQTWSQMERDWRTKLRRSLMEISGAAADLARDIDTN